MLSALIIGAIAVSVAIGYKTKINTGFFAMAFAYLIGCFAMGMSTKAVIGGWPVSTMFVIFSLLLIAGFRYIPKRNRNIGKGMVFEKPEPFTSKQKINLYLMLGMIAVVLIFPILHIVLPQVKIITFINGKIDVGMLINVAIEAGTIDLLSSWAGSSLPVGIVPIAFSIIGAIMSFFSSTLGVVCPALFPLVPSLAAATGLSPLVLFTCIIIGAQSSAISPFSSGGSLVLGSCTTEEERSEMFPRLLFVAVPCSVLAATAYNFLLSLIL